MELRENRDAAGSTAYGHLMARGQRRRSGSGPVRRRSDDEYLAIWQERYEAALAEGNSPAMAGFCAKQHLRAVRRADAGIVDRVDLIDYDFDAFAAWR